MPYNDRINWPLSKDIDFPTVFNNESSVVDEDEKFYAEHYNKVRNFVVKAYLLLVDGQAGVGDGSVKRLSFPYTFRVSLKDVLTYSAYDASVGTDLRLPGNVIPFEFVVTFSGDPYFIQKNRTEFDFLLEKSSSLELSKVFGAVSPISSKTLVSGNLVINDTQKFSLTTKAPNKNQVIVSAFVGTNTILIRGVVIDYQISSGDAEYGNTLDIWKSSTIQRPELKITIQSLS
jgi:hypothetical protein